MKSTNLHTQEVQQASNEIKVTKPILRHIIRKVLKNKKKILKVASEKMTCSRQGNSQQDP